MGNFDSKVPAPKAKDPGLVPMILGTVGGLGLFLLCIGLACRYFFGG